MKAHDAILASVGAAAIAAWVWNAYCMTNEALSAAKRAEAKKLFAAGFATANAVAAVKVPVAVDSQVAAVRKAAPRAKVVATREAETKPGVARGTAPCLVRPGDRLQIRVSEADLRTENANLVMVGQASIWNLDHNEKIYEAEFDASLTRHYVTPERDARVTERWGLGPNITVTSRGLAYGITARGPVFDGKVLLLVPEISTFFGRDVSGVTLAAVVMLPN